MARRKGRIKDKWREKRWVNVNAPDSFNNVPLAYVPITDDENASGRVVEVTLFDILKGDPSQHQYKIYFQIDKVDGDNASTIFKRFEYSKEFLRSLVRRGSSKINFIIDIKTKDGYVFRIKIIALTMTISPGIANVTANITNVHINKKAEYFAFLGIPLSSM